MKLIRCGKNLKSTASTRIWRTFTIRSFPLWVSLRPKWRKCPQDMSRAWRLSEGMTKSLLKKPLRLQYLKFTSTLKYSCMSYMLNLIGRRISIRSIFKTMNKTKRGLNQISINSRRCWWPSMRTLEKIFTLLWEEWLIRSRITLIGTLEGHSIRAERWTILN